MHSFIFILKILGVFCAFMLAKSIRRTKSMRAARTWQLQQSLGILSTGFEDNGKPAYEDYTQLDKNDHQIEPIVNNRTR